MGKTDFVTKTTTDAIAQNLLSGPTDLDYDPVTHRLFVPDGAYTSRVLIFDLTTITNGENAINVLGQTNFTNFGAADPPTQTSMNFPIAVRFDPVRNQLLVSDMNNDRLLFYDVNPSTMTNGEPAINILGAAELRGL